MRKCKEHVDLEINNNIRELSQPPGLGLYSSRLQTIVSADTWLYGLRAEMPQKQEDDTTKPGVYASTTLNRDRLQQNGSLIHHIAMCAILRLPDWHRVSHKNRPLVFLLGSKNLDKTMMRLMRYSFSVSHIVLY